MLWTECLFTLPVDGATVANVNTITSMLGTGSGVVKPTIQPGYIYSLARAFKIRAAGKISTVVTTPGTLTFTLLFGAVSVAVTQAMALNTTAQTNATWILDWDLQVRAIGGSTNANLMHVAAFTSRASLNAPAVGTTNEVGVILCPDTAMTVGTGFDASASQQVDLSATWSVQNASNSITMQMMSLTSLVSGM